MTKEQELTQRLGAILQDLNASGSEHPEAILEIGSLTAMLLDRTQQPTWTGMKSAIPSDGYLRLLTDLENEGNARYQGGEPAKAYACQALGFSLVLRTHRDNAALREGEKLLDTVIEGAVRVFRQSRPTA